MSTTAILGGTFDPIHVGHLQMALEAMKQTGAHRCMILPDGNPPHKTSLTASEHRIAMARLAVAGIPAVAVSDMEISRPGITYTIDTLIELRKHNPQEQFCYIIGADTLSQLETWRDFPQVAKLLACFAVAPRQEPQNQPDDIERMCRLRDRFHVEFVPIAMRTVDVSSTEIRRRVARHQSIEGMVPPQVEAYIAHNALYQDPMIEEIIRTMSPARYRHTLGVEKCAIELARRFGADPAKASLAALLHDCAKYMEVAEMCDLVDRQHVKTGHGERESRALLHAAAGVAMAKERFHIEDEDILNAVRWHTTGRENMTTLEKIIYLADVIEPNRREFSALKSIREAAQRDLNEAMYIAAKSSVAYVKMRNMPLNQRTLELLHSLEKARRNTE